ncbi:hypothetical protein AM231_04865 [Paenibacillus solani]|uniref:Uncharacterized protein n=1 Tax=Paenibacillus solani TaxID=1705565 RepID=A0A0M1P2C8_9BACL|nr:hypothetical protein AM231_04865 [Paenibacillus solani]
MMGRVRHEILYVQAAEIFGRFCEGDPKYVSQELTACPGVTKPPPGTRSALLVLGEEARIIRSMHGGHTTSIAWKFFLRFKKAPARLASGFLRSLE